MAAVQRALKAVRPALEAVRPAESAVTRDVENLRFRDTRGRIYAFQGRWKDAVADLERALPGAIYRRLKHAFSYAMGIGCVGRRP